MSRQTLRAAGLAAILYAALTPWVLRPWFLAPDTLARPLPGLGAMAEADLNLNVWILAWIAHAVVHDPSRLFDGNIYYPAPNTIAGSENMLAHVPVTVPTLALTGDASIVLKAMAFESFVLAGLAMFLLVRFHTADSAAAFVAGACYTFTRFRVQTLFQPQYLGSAGFPLALLAVDAWLARGRRWALVGLSAAMALQALSCVYLGYFAFLSVPIYALARVWQRPRGARLGPLVRLGAAIAAGALLVAPAFLPYLRARAAGIVPRHDIALVGAFSLSPASYLSPALLEWVGGVPTALALLGLVLWAFGRPQPRPAPERATWALAAAGVFFSFGPSLDLGAFTLPLPYNILFHWLPGFSAIRAPARFILVVATALSILAGYAVARLWARWPPATRALGSAALVLACLAVAAPTPAPTLAAHVGRHAHPAYVWLAAQPPGGAVVEIPSGHVDSDVTGNLQSSRYMVGSTVHWHPLVNGYTAYEPPSAAFLQAAMRRLPDPDALGVLVDSVDVRWIVVRRRDLLPPQREAWDRADPPGLERIGDFDGDVVFAVRRPPERPWRTELLPRSAARQPATLTGTPIEPLATACRQGGILSVDAPPVIPPIAFTYEVPITFENTSDCPWPGLDVRPDGLVGITFEWVSPSGRRYPRGPFTRLLQDVPPHTTVHDTMLLGPPGSEPGTWTAEVLLVQHGDPEPIARKGVRVDVAPPAAAGGRSAP